MTTRKPWLGPALLATRAAAKCSRPAEEASAGPSSSPAAAPSFEEVEDRIRTTLWHEKRVRAAEALLREPRSKARVERLL